MITYQLKFVDGKKHLIMHIEFCAFFGGGGGEEEAQCPNMRYRIEGGKGLINLAKFCTGKFGKL